MKLHRLGLLLLGSMVLTSCRVGRLVAIGFDDGGRAVAAAFNEGIYKQRLKETLLTVDGAVTSNLASLPRGSGDSWELQVIAIGINLRAEAGFGPFKFGIVPGVRAFFTNVDNPPPLP